MIDRACISINNRCNLSCIYCHFRSQEKLEYLHDKDMNVYKILDNIKLHIDKLNIQGFKLGFVGNGEPVLDFDALKGYIVYISDYLYNGKIKAYTITNGTLVTKDHLEFFRNYNVDVGFSIDGIPEIHNKWRCKTHNIVIRAINDYHLINGCYPSMNCTVGADVLAHYEETIDFFVPFDSKITFSRMIGENGITLSEFHQFIDKAKLRLKVRTGGYDCTMYGGKCGAGINNIFYANGCVYLCGNCVDLPPIAEYDTELDAIKPDIPFFDRTNCYKELYKNTAIKR